MAKLNGIIKLNGSIGGITFFQKNGESFARQQNGPNKKKIQSDPSFARTRENNQEFGGAALIGKGLRAGLVQEFEEMADSNTTGRLTQLMKKIISLDENGKRGERSFFPVMYKDLFLNFQFSERRKFDSIFFAPYSAAVNAERNEVVITVPDFNTANYVNAPSGATHFRIINLITVLSQYNFNTSTKKYMPVDLNMNSKNDFAASDYLALGTNLGADVQITCTLDGQTIMNSSALIACIGIEFYQQLGQNYYLLSASNAMKIQDVF